MIWYALANEASDKFSVSDNFFLLLLKKLNYHDSEKYIIDLQTYEWSE